MAAVQLVIRDIESGDADAAAILSDELGYPASTDEMRSRIEYVRSKNGCVVLVACLSGEVVGWVDVAIAHHLQSGKYAEIGGLVVSTGARGAGIGKELVAAAEQWAARQGIREILVRSQISRDRAHGFYLREGYTRTKTSAVFRKQL